MRHRDVNVQYTEDALLRFPTANVGIAVAAPQGLVVPVVQPVERLSLAEVAGARGDVVGRARDEQARRRRISKAARSRSRTSACSASSSSSRCSTRRRRRSSPSVRRVDTPVVRDGEVVVAADDDDDAHRRPPRRRRRRGRRLPAHREEFLEDPALASVNPTRTRGVWSFMRDSRPRLCVAVQRVRRGHPADALRRQLGQPGRRRGDRADTGNRVGATRLRRFPKASRTWLCVRRRADAGAHDRRRPLATQPRPRPRVDGRAARRRVVKRAPGQVSLIVENDHPAIAFNARNTDRARRRAGQRPRHARALVLHLHGSTPASHALCQPACTTAERRVERVRQRVLLVQHLGSGCDELRRAPRGRTRTGITGSQRAVAECDRRERPRVSSSQPSTAGTNPEKPQTAVGPRPAAPEPERERHHAALREAAEHDAARAAARRASRRRAVRRPRTSPDPGSRRAGRCTSALRPAAATTARAGSSRRGAASGSSTSSSGKRSFSSAPRPWKRTSAPSASPAAGRSRTISPRSRVRAAV